MPLPAWVGKIKFEESRWNISGLMLHPNEISKFVNMFMAVYSRYMYNVHFSINTTNDKKMAEIDHRFFSLFVNIGLTLINNVHEHVNLCLLIDNNQNKYFDHAFL